MSNINKSYNNSPFLFNGLKIQNHDINNANKKILDRNISVFGKSPCFHSNNVDVDSSLKNIDKKCINYRPPINPIPRNPKHS